MDTSSQFKPVLTKAALALQNKREGFKALIFEEPKPSLSVENILVHKSRKSLKYIQPSQEDENEFDIKKARHEVLNFAMNNQRINKNQKKMQIFQMIKLGAKPPKKAYKNYKELLDERKRLKNIREERKKFHQLGKNQTGAAAVKCHSKTKMEKQSRTRLPVAGIDQHYGVVKPKLKKRK